MSHPFPGMNPWLEDARLGRDVHQSLITALRDVLAPQLEPRYFVAVETHTYIAATPTQPIHTRDPDVSILRIGEAAIAYTPPAATLPLVIDLPLSEPYCANRFPAFHCRCCRAIQSRRSTSALFCMPCTTAPATSW